MGSLGDSSTASIIGGSFDVANNLLNMYGTQRANEQSYDQAKKLWALNNEYNKPVNQMKRLEEAGLNPFLVYGNGATGNTSSQPSSPSVQRNHFDVNMAQAVMFGKNIEKINEEIEHTKKANELLKTQLANLRYNSGLFKNLGLPTNSAWWSPSVMGWISDPEKINILKKLGFSGGDLMRGVIEGFMGPRPYERTNNLDLNEINLDWNKNGVVNREVIYEYTE